MDKKGLISAEALIGIVVGGIFVVILITIVFPYVTVWWEMFFGVGVDSQTQGSFDRLVEAVKDINDGESKEIPLWVNEELTIVSFSKEVDKLKSGLICNQRVFGSTFFFGTAGVDDLYEITDKEITKPCKDSCLCLCKTNSPIDLDEYRIEKCLKKNCVDINFDLEGVCEGYVVLPGYTIGIMSTQREWYNVKINRMGDLIKLEGLLNE